MSTAVGLEAARRAFLAGEWSETRVAEVVHPAVAASWARCRRGGLDPDAAVATFRGLEVGPDPGKEVFDTFVASGARCSLVFFDVDGLVRSRSDTDPELARLLDGLRLVPGYGYGEAAMGTTAAAVALATGEPAALSGPEHYAAALTCLAEAAA